MARRLILEFTKMNGAGNDFIVIDNRFYHFSDRELAGIARHYCRRRFGVERMACSRYQCRRILTTTIACDI